MCITAVLTVIGRTEPCGVVFSKLAELPIDFRRSFFITGRETKHAVTTIPLFSTHEKGFQCGYTHLSNFTSATYMTDQDLCYTSASELLRMLDRRDISSVELTETILRRIDDLDPELNGFATLTPKIAL